jgi:predicted secreted protein
VGEPAGASRSPSPTVEEFVAQLTRHPLVAEGSTEPAAAVAEEPAATEAQEEAPAEAGLVDIASILGAPTVTVVRSSL